MADKKKKIELWSGYEVEVNEQIINDFDFISDLAKAEKEQDFSEMMSLYFAVVGGEEVFNATRAHIIEEKGFFEIDSLLEIVKKISDAFPKVGKRAQKQYGKISI